MQRTQLTSERGAIAIHVAVASLVLIAFTMFVADYGILAVSRHQAQNAADAGAHAGAIALAFDDFNDRTNAGPAKVAARAFALANDVWAEDPEVNIDTDVVFVDCPDDDSPPSIDQTPCIRVDVYRGAPDRIDNDTIRGNPLPVWFGQLVGLTNQGVRATATGEVATGNASDCMKPWGVADKWDENNPDPINGTWSAGATYDPDPTFPTRDVYTPPDPATNNPGTGFRVPEDVGTQLQLQVGSGSPGDVINPGWFQALDLCTGLPDCDYPNNIRGCVKSIWGIGDQIPTQPGDMAGQTGSGTQELIDLDPNATWDPALMKVINSCVGPPYTCSQPGYIQSPRIVAVPVFDLDHYLATGGPGSGTVLIVNILGFFVESIGNPPNATVTGYLVTKADLVAGNKGQGTAAASFLKNPRLVR